MSSASQSLRDHGLTLEDYLAHQRTLRTLQQSQPVFIVDEVLGLRYRARLQLRLRPTRHLLLSDDTGLLVVRGGTGTPAAPPSLRIPLTPSCRVEVCDAATDRRREKALRITPPSPPPRTVASSSSSLMEEVDDSYLLVPISSTLSDAESLVYAWTAVLCSLCLSPGGAAAAGAAATTRLTVHSARQASHADPLASTAAANSRLLTCGTEQRNGGAASADAATSPACEGAPPRDVALERFLFSPAPRAPSPPTVSSHPQTTVGAGATPANVSGGVTAASSPAFSLPTPIQQPSTEAADAAVEEKTDQEEGMVRDAARVPPQQPQPQPQQPNAPANKEASAPALRNPRRSDEPPPLRRALSEADVAPFSCEAEQERLHRLLYVLRGRTGQAADLSTHFSSSLSPSRSSLPRDDGKGRVENGPGEEDRTGAYLHSVDVAHDPHGGDDDDDHEASHQDRPPTMAHISSGLVPALDGFAPQPLMQTSEDEDDDDGAVREIVVAPMGHHSGSDGGGGGGVHAESGSTGRRDGGVQVAVTSPRPQAPRSNHVCGDLGSLGPSCGDAEALRIYNEIHGIRSAAARDASAVDSTLSNASSFASSAYGSSRDGGVGGPGEAEPDSPVHRL